MCYTIWPNHSTHRKCPGNKTKEQTCCGGNIVQTYLQTQPGNILLNRMLRLSGSVSDSEPAVSPACGAVSWFCPDSCIKDSFTS